MDPLQTTFAAFVENPSPSRRRDVLVCGDDEKAQATAMGLLGRIGFRAPDAGKRRAARTIEQITVLTTTMDVRDKAHFKSGRHFAG